MSARALAVLLLALLTACATNPWREQPPPWTQATVDDADDARVTLANGTVQVFTAPTIIGTGDGALLSGIRNKEKHVVPLASIGHLETRHYETWRVLGYSTLVVVGTVVGSLIVLALAI